MNTRVIEAILNAIHTKDYKSSVSDLIIDCPFCDGRKKLYVSTGLKAKKGLYHCFRCGEKGFTNVTIPLPNFVFDDNSKHQFSLAGSWFLEFGRNEDFAEEYDRAVDFLNSRNIEPKYYPIFKPFVRKGDENIYFAYVEKSNIENVELKTVEYILARNISKRCYRDIGKKPVFFMNGTTGKHVILCEGLFDAVTLYASVDGGIAVAAMLGKYLSPSQLLKLRNFDVKRVSLIIDPTEDLLTKRCVATQLVLQGIDVRLVHYYGTSDDPNELGVEGCKQLIDLFKDKEFGTIVNIKRDGNTFEYINTEGLQ